MIEHDGRAEAQTGRSAEPVAQFQRGQGVETEVAEGAVRVDVVNAAMPEHGGHLGAHPAEHHQRAFGERDGVQPPDQGRVGHGTRAGGGARPGRRPHQFGQRCGDRAPAVRGGGVEAQGQDDGARSRDRLVEHGQPVRHRQRDDPGARHPGAVGAARHAARDVPQAPGQRDGGQAGGAAGEREGVEEGVARRVVALPGGAERAGRRREQREHRQVEMLGEAVQVQRRVDLRAQHPVDPLAGEFEEGPVVEDPGGVHDGDQRMPGGYAVQHARQRGLVSGVAGHPLDLGTGTGEVVLEVGGTGGGVPAPAEQEEASRPVAPDEVPRDEAAEGPGGTGDQDGAAAQVGNPVVAARRADGPGQPGYFGDAAPERDLWLAARQRRGQRAGRLGGPVVIDEDEAARMLQLHGPDEAPHRRSAGSGAVHGAAGHHGEPDCGRPVVEEPFPDTLGGPYDGVADRLGGRRPGVSGHQDGVRRRHLVIGGKGFDGGVPRGRDVGQGISEDGHLHVRVSAGLLGGRERAPLHGQRRRGGAGARLRGQRAQGERSDGGDEAAGGIGDRQRHRVAARGGDAYPNVRGAHRVQGRPVPRERHPVLVGGINEVTEARGVQAGVKQGRVQAVGARVDGHVLGQGDLGEDVGAIAPCRPQSAERRPVDGSAGGEPVVVAIAVDRRRARRRPRGRALVRDGRHVRREGAGGVALPGHVGVVGGPGVHGQDTPGPPRPARPPAPGSVSRARTGRAAPPG
ncbi:hypothetical protein LUX57_51505 [Actinomadura madurae]|nr:hypothetical protein [Actinomadura madurae]MCP9972489.1 hypothetical protein [Actinomadura madurae]